MNEERIEQLHQHLDLPRSRSTVGCMRYWPVQRVRTGMIPDMATGPDMQLTRQTGEHLVAAELVAVGMWQPRFLAMFGCLIFWPPTCGASRLQFT